MTTHYTISRRSESPLLADDLEAIHDIVAAACRRAGFPEPNAPGLEQLRAEQARRVMPHIGPLLDGFEGLPNDLLHSLQVEAEPLYRSLLNILNAVECDQ